MDPYRQSERLDFYKEAIQKLVDAGYAYPCFCTAERLNELRKQQIENKRDSTLRWSLPKSKQGGDRSKNGCW